MKKNDCIVCGSKGCEIIYEENIFKDERIPLRDRFRNTSTATFAHSGQVVKCIQCGMVYVDTLPHADEAIRHAYEEVEDALYLKNVRAKIYTFNRVMEQIEKYKPTGNLLDVGCYYGVLLHVAKIRKWEVSGVELSRQAVKYAKMTFDINVSNGGLKDASYPDDNFDVVTLLAVIEHMVNPPLELNEIRRITKKGGILAVATHNIESILAKIMGRNYPWLCEMHLYHFSPRTLGVLLENSGFKVIKHYSYGQVYNLGYVSERIGKSNLLYKTISQITGLPFIAKFNIPINTRDAFLTIAQKK